MMKLHDIKPDWNTLKSTKAKTDPQNLKKANNIIIQSESTIVSSNESFMQLSGNLKIVDSVNWLGEYARY